MTVFTLVTRTLYNKPTRHQIGAVECLLIALVPPIKKRRHPPN